MTPREKLDAALLARQEALKHYAMAQEILDATGPAIAEAYAEVYAEYVANRSPKETPRPKILGS